MAEVYLTAKSSLEFKWSFFHGSDGVHYTKDTRIVQSFWAHVYFCRELDKDFLNVYRKVLVPVVPGRFSRADVKVVSHFYRGSPESSDFSRQSPAAGTVRSGFDGFYGNDFGDNSNFDAIDGGASMCVRWTEVRSTFHRYRHLLVEYNKLVVLSSLNGLSIWLIADARMDEKQFPTS